MDVENQPKPSAVWYYYNNCLDNWLKFVTAKGQNAAIFKVDMEILYITLHYHVDKSQNSY